MSPERRLPEQRDERRDHSPRLRSGGDDSLEQDSGDDLGQLARRRRLGRAVGRRGRRVGEQVEEEVREEPRVRVRVSELVRDRRDQVVLA